MTSLLVYCSKKKKKVATRQTTNMAPKATIEIIVFIIVITTINIKHVYTFDYDLVYWELPPFIYTKNDRVVGIYKDTWDAMDKQCGHKGSLRPKVKFKNYKEFSEHLKNPNIDANYTKDAKLRNATGTFASWFPVITTDFEGTVGVRKKNLHYSTMFNVPGLAVFARRDQITLIYKMYLSLKATMQILILFVVIIAVFVAILVWLSEFYRNEDIKREFSHGSLKSLWLDFVTMTTVGYGDVTTKSFVGRVVMTAWMLCGLFFASALTAFATGDYYQTRHLEITNKTVGILKNSFEKQVVRKYWECTIKEYDTYEGVLDGLRNGETYLSIINIYTAAYYQIDMNKDTSKKPLAIVNTFKEINIPVMGFIHFIVFPAPHIQKCAIATQPYAGKNALAKNIIEPKVDKIYIPPLWELLGEDVITYTLIFIGSVLFLGLVFDLFYISKLAKKKTSVDLTNREIDANKQHEREEEEREENNEEIEFNTLPECAEELLRLGHELTEIKEALTQVSDNVARDTIRKPTTHSSDTDVNNNYTYNKNTVIQLEAENYSHMVY